MSKGTRTPLWVAEQIARELSEKLGDLPHQVCGSIRRGTKTEVGDLDLCVSDIAEAVKRLGVQITSGGSKRVEFEFRGLSSHMYVASPEEWGAMLLFLTGNAFFNRITRARARDRGLKLNQYGLWDGEVRIAGHTEDEIFDALNMRRVPPSEREK